MQLVDLVRAYCHGEFSEEVVKSNFVLIYELLDEVLDHGYPQVTDPAVMKSFIFQKVGRNKGHGCWWGGGEALAREEL